MNQAESKDLYLRWEELRSLFTVSTYSKGVRLALEAQRQAQSWSVEEAGNFCTEAERESSSLSSSVWLRISPLPSLNLSSYEMISEDLSNAEWR